jgi:hypothetical protein
LRSHLEKGPIHEEFQKLRKTDAETIHEATADFGDASEK